MILTFDNEHWVNELLRNLFSSIDKLIYTLIGWIMEGIFNLSGLVTNFDLARSIYNRIYVVLALFMIFKLTLSFLQYITNPDAMNDKERGVGKLISRVVIMLGLLVLFPILFFEEVIEVNGDKQTLLEATQTGVIKTLPKVILGIDDVSDGDASQGTIASNAAKNGEYMAIEMLKAFYYPVSCSDSESASDSSCESDQINNLDAFEASVVLASDGKYTYKYMWPLTTVAGIALAVILIGIAIDVAIRVFKLLLLQLLAPIPIMTYIDPKSSKDGAFSSWMKSFTSTYLDIFIKLGTVYLMLMLFSEAFSTDGGLFSTEHGISNIEGFMARNFVKVFLVIGLFKFAKDAPKFIKDALGMKDSGNGGIFGGLSTLGAAAGTVGGALAGAVSGGFGGFAAGKAAGQKNGMAILKGLGGGLAGAGRGGMQGAKGAGKGNLIKGVSGAVAAQTALNQRKIEAGAGNSTWKGRMGARFDEFFSRDPSILTADEDAKHLNTASDKTKKLWDYAEGKGYTKMAGAHIGTAKSYTDIGGRAVRSVTHKAGDHVLFKNAYEKAQMDGATSMTFRGVTYDMATAGLINTDFKEQAATAYLTSYGATDSNVTDQINDINRELDAVSSGNIGGVKPIDISDKTTINADSAKTMRGQAVAIKPTADALRTYKANKDAIKKGK